MDDRFFWAQVMSELRGVLTKVEDRMRTDMGGGYTGVWIENFKTAEPRADADSGIAGGESSTGSEYAARAAAMAAFRKRYGLDRTAAAAPATPAADTSSTDTSAVTRSSKKKGSTNDVSSITITFRAVSLENAKAGANKEIVYAVLGGITSNPLFDPDPAETKDTGNIGPVEDPGTFTFKLIVGLKRPLSL
jgi:hypothetical protein